MNRLSRAGIAVVLLAGVLWASGVAEAGNLLPTLKVCVDASSGVVSRVASSTKCVGGAKFWSASKSAPLLCWNASSLNPSDRTRVVSVAPSAGCAAPLSLVPVGRAQLLCADGETGVLRWPMTESCASGNLQTWIRSAATPITVATTTTTTSTTSTTAVVVPSVSLSATAIQGNTWPRAVTVTANVAGTIYFAEGDFVVKTVADITSASSDRWAKGTVASANTPTSIAIDVNAVTNGYYRVYVANSQGVLSAPATNIVTISITRASTATTTTTSTTIALTCAQGGSCTVGVDTGPGGGKVFYAAAGTFASPGSPCNTAGVGGISTCKYLEAAPTTGSSAWTDVFRNWATNINSNQTTAVSGADGTAIGTGRQNTSDIIAQSGNVAATSAAVEADAYRGPNSLSDWFLPSKDELNELCKYAKNTGQASGSGIICGEGSAATGRGFLNVYYWSSSEFDADYAWGQTFFTGFQLSNYKFGNFYVRPVRAF